MDIQKRSPGDSAVGIHPSWPFETQLGKLHLTHLDPSTLQVRSAMDLLTTSRSAESAFIQQLEAYTDFTGLQSLVVRTIDSTDGQRPTVADAPEPSKQAPEPSVTADSPAPGMLMLLARRPPPWASCAPALPEGSRLDPAGPSIECAACAAGLPGWSGQHIFSTSGRGDGNPMCPAAVFS